MQPQEIGHEVSGDSHSGVIYLHEILSWSGYAIGVMKTPSIVTCRSLCALALCVFVCAAARCDELQPAEVTFEKHVRPIFARHCFVCHGKQKKAELDLRSGQSILKGSESGPVISGKVPKEGLLYEVIHEQRMPPKGKESLTRAEIEILQRWLLSGANFAESPKKEAARLNQHFVMPILRLRCTVCHGRQVKQAGLDLRTRASILKGGKSGPAMVLGQPEKSLILRRVHAGEMPPKDKLAAFSVKPMGKAEVQRLTAWIRAAAPEEDVAPDVATTRGDPLVSDQDRDFWSFRSPRSVSVPRLLSDQVRNPIDAFVLKRLQDRKLGFSRPAERMTLLRRATIDLLGLPPTPADVEQFLNDRSPHAYEHLIDRLLSSPRYGERWGRYWLDLAGYSDSEGVQHADRVRPEAYRYRDYVIRSLNDDKPYDRFLLEQIAGDELVDYRQAKTITDEIYNNLVATGFLRMSPDGTYAGITAFVPDRLEIIDDELEVLSSSVMALTVRCARCHSHKFDPIPQRDYYRLAAVLKGALDEHDWLEPSKKRYLPHVRQDEQQAWSDGNERITAEIREIESMLAIKEQQFARKYAPQKFKTEELKKRDPAFAKIAELSKAKIKALNGRRRPKPQVRALWDRGEPSPTYILRRGNYLSSGRLVGPGIPSVLSDGKTPFVVKPPFPGATGRRLAFARWLTEPNHPLTARVFVNRVWKHHFGRGIVATLDNFGRAGERPTHPQLLDWLATEFVRNNWSIKALHRLLMTSTTYRQSSDVDPLREQIDSDNRWLSRMQLRRMEGEVIRDSLLQASGRLDLRPYGPADSINAREDGLVLAVGNRDTWRRTIFVQQRRTSHLTILDNFDLPRMNPNCIERRASVVAPQALHMLNNRRIYELSKHFAARVLRESNSRPIDQIRRMYLLALGRPATAEEERITSAAFRSLQAEWMTKLKGQETAVAASTHLWIRRSDPEKVYEKDLISVWSSARELRYGLVEFDVSGLGAADWKSARLDLGVLNNAAIKQTARLIPTGISGLTWSKFQQSKKQHQQRLEAFGRISDQDKASVGSYAKSLPASAKDLRLLNDARKSGRLAFVLVADEDGNPYWRDWDDGSKGTLPRLMVRRDAAISKANRTEATERAMQTVCHAIMNSAAFLYID